ncbi:MAG: DUF433 domain-containing protein [Deltaproteobacteria bacterium]|jgi:uncharacterized protein (DUF433 family)|nr:DUF433 domain-containing protein [Deltaproteobacteria bacterium]
MGAVQKSLRIPQGTFKEIERIARETGRDFSSIAKDLLAEAIKMRRCPGIVFADGVSGRRARIAGTGLEVWEVISTYRSVNQDFSRLQKAYHWLTEQQLRAAIGYYTAYREEIDEVIKRNETWSRDAVAKRFPFLSRKE